MSAGVRHGVEVWSSDEWLASATAWADASLAAAGMERTGEPALERVRPWAATLRIPAGDTAVWLKACAPATAFEVPLYGILARIAPERILAPIAADAGRAWLLLPDGGLTLAERPGDPADGLIAALAAYGRLQRRLEGGVGEMLAAGVPDMRPAAMPARLDEALAAAAGAPGADAEVLARAEALRDPVAEWSAALASSPLPASLDHNDLHAANVLGDPADPRFYDWGDSVVAHPFAALLVPLDVLDPSRREEAAAAYLAAFADLAPRTELRAELGTARRLARVARALTWERALRGARERGEPIDPRFENAVLETLLRAVPAAG